MSDRSEKPSDDHQTVPPKPVEPDHSQRQLTGHFLVPTRRTYRIATISVPSEKLLLIDPTLDHGIEIAPVLSLKIVVQAHIWALPDGSTLVGGVQLAIPPFEKSAAVGKRTIKAQGRVEIQSGIIAISDRDQWHKRSPSWRGEEVRRCFDQFGLGETSISEARGGPNAVLLPTGYGAGNFAVVASLCDDRICEVDVFMLKGGTP